MILSFNGAVPKVGSGVFVAPTAHVIGDVELGGDCSIFFGAVLRGDILAIRLGRRCNVQENSVFHTSTGRSEVVLGEEVTVGHAAIIHSARVGSRVIVGMGSILLDDAVIGDECIIGAGSIITEGKQIPPRSLVFGSPAKVIRALTEEELRFLPLSAAHYVEKGRQYLSAFAAGK